MHQHLALSVLIFDDHDDEYNFGNVPRSHDDLMMMTYHNENVDQHDENDDDVVSDLMHNAVAMC